MSYIGYHEPIAELTDATRDIHRAIVSLTEELEAVDWYNQRADACQDMELNAILLHNSDEEKKHAFMLLEWIRRRDPQFSSRHKDYLFTGKPLARDYTSWNYSDRTAHVCVRLTRILHEGTAIAVVRALSFDNRARLSLFRSNLVQTPVVTGSLSGPQWSVRSRAMINLACARTL